jgi:WD40-like Beta Propeller Repeat
MTPMMMGTSRIVALAFCLLACACGGSSGVDEGTAMLVLDPPTSEHLIENGVLPTQGFTATLVDADGNKKDVTKDATFFIETSFGDFSGSTLTIKSPGKMTVSALFTDKQGSAQVIARVKTKRVDDGVPPTAPDLFSGGTEDPSKAPTVVYPADGVTMPRNIGDFEAHWIDPVNDVFEVSLQSEFADIRVYVLGNNGVGGGPRPSWFAFTPTEWSYAAASESTVNYQVRGANTTAPGTIGSAPVRIVRLTNEAMEGGVYYWAAAGAEYGIFRHDVSQPGQPAEPFMTDVSTGKCVACHALSRDGTTMAITYDGGDGRATIVDVATKTAQPVPAVLTGAPDPFIDDTSRWNFATLYPDGSRMLTVFKGVITVRQTSDQGALATMPSAGAVSHPDLATDLSKLVYVRKPTGGADWSFTSGSIYTRTYDPATLAFGPETPLVADGGHYFYPSFSPDGQWVMFNKATPPTDAYNNVDASLWVVKADGSTAPVQLSAFNAAAGGLTNSWGRWAPFQQTVGAGNEPIFWVTTSSKRDFGVRRINTGQAEGAKTPQIWMAPFYTGRAASGMDPTAPAFRLPFQNLASNNHIAQWTERVVEVQ